MPASTNAILGLKEVVLTTTTGSYNDDDYAIYLKALADAQEKDAIADDNDLNALAALAADQDAHQEEEEATDGDDDTADDEKTTMMSTARLRPLRLQAMPCSHVVFHQHCIFQWLSRNAVCPLCRHKLPTIEDDDDR